DMAYIIKELEPDYREPLMMKYGSGYSAEEISEMLGISINLVYQRIYRGKSILYDRLTKE
ncbi:MAG: RNA polymerase subunit sigma, partial [Clostridia bacterium]|nr:RNA polymerase subunit sigma [Clostridia bacterium]